MKKGSVFESPDGGRTVYVRNNGETVRHLYQVDPLYQKEQVLIERWKRLKKAVYMAETDATINDALNKLEILIILKSNELRS